MQQAHGPPWAVACACATVLRHGGVRARVVSVLQPLSTAASFEPGLYELPAMLREYGPPRPGLAFVLATDGLTDNRAGWQQELRLAIGQESLQDALQQLLALNRATQYDDLTLAVARFT